MARSSVAVRWADIGNLILHDGADPANAVPALLSAGAEWQLLGGVTRLFEDDPSAPREAIVRWPSSSAWPLT
jgi:hypothetical protein